MSSTIPYFSEWPKIESAITQDEATEKKIAEILQQMTLEEKIGQMIQPNLRDVTPEEAKEYKLGSLLNGGGTWANDDKYASALDWAQESDKYWHALKEAYTDRPFDIPFMWASDAVHGHNNIFKATLYPHNIGLGAANDTDLIFRIGRATAKEVAATGMDWTFAPTVATPRNLHWGRTYEGYSEDPEIVYHYAGKMVEGLQGDAEQLQGYEHVLSNVKHWIGDGGTENGIDRGNNPYDEELLINIHAAGYFSGLTAGAQVVMSSFSGWTDPKNTSLNHEEYNQKLSGSHYLLTQVLKEKMNFDGAIVSDWNSHAEVTACEDGNANYCVNAGLDILMVTARTDWKNTIANLIAGVQSGEVSEARIDDAVTRILRIKMRAGLWQKSAPSERLLVQNTTMLGCEEHKTLAREAVRKSLVLLKNNDALLPLSRNQKVIVTGSAADDIQKMTGGWSITWQGADNTEADFPGCQTVSSAVRQTVGEENCFIDPELKNIDQYQESNLAIVAIGEDPYAEIVGDIKNWQTLEYAKLKRAYAKDIKLIRTLKEAGKKVITLFFSGRPLYVNEEINLSDAFIAAWLPGTEGLGITDVLFRDENNDIQYDFQGTLSFSWPAKKNAFAVNRIPPHIPNYQVPECEQAPEGENAPLFPFGYGLSYSKESPVPALHEDLNQLPLDQDETSGEQEAATQPLELFGVLATGDHVLRMADHNNWLIGTDVTGNNDTICEGLESKPVDFVHQQDGRRITCKGSDAMLYLQTIDQGVDNLKSYLLANGKLEVVLKMIEQPESPVQLAIHRDIPSSPTLDITNRLKALPLNEWQTLSVNLSEFDAIGCEFEHVNSPFMLFTQGKCIFELGCVRWNIG